MEFFIYDIKTGPKMAKKRLDTEFCFPLTQVITQLIFSYLISNG